MSSNKAILQQIEEEHITLSIDGKIEKVALQLDKLLKLLEGKGVQNIQYAEKIYNIEHINEANFGFVTGKKAFNEQLTKSLMESIKTYSIPAQNLLREIEYRKIANWEKTAEISNTAKKIIGYSFTGEIGKQFAKLIAIGKEELSDKKQAKYINQCINTLAYSLDLINFVLLSAIWDNSLGATKNSAIPAEEAISVQRLFESSFPSSLEDRFTLLTILFQLFEARGWELPIPELKTIAAQLQQKSELADAIQSMQQLKSKLDELNYNLLDCFEAEKALLTCFQSLAFLVNYNMASIKQIGYHEVRNQAPMYLHRYTALGIDNKANVDAERVIGVSETVHTDAVLFFKGKNYQNSINLYPFVVDYNTLATEYGAKICFFQCRHFEDDSLNYVFLDDNKMINIEKKGRNDVDEIGEVMIDQAKQKIYNLNSVISTFEQAKRGIFTQLKIDAQ